MLWVLGHDVFGMRLLPAVLGVVATPLVYLLGRELFNHRAGALAALVIALDRVAVQRAVSARPSTLPLVCLLLAAPFLVRGQRGSGWRDRVGLIAGAVVSQVPDARPFDKLRVVSLSNHNTWFDVSVLTPVAGTSPVGRGP